MSLITKYNYEAYLLDYVEKNLSPGLIAELMLFFENNPELKEDLADFELYELMPLEIEKLEKSGLKKEIGIVTSTNYEDFIIAEVEGQNTVQNSAALHLFLEQNIEKQGEFIAYQKTRLIAPTIVFKNKNLLKKKSGVIIPMYWWYSSAAAVVIILFSLNSFNSSDQVYFPIANRVIIDLEKDVFDEDVIDGKIIIDEKQLATIVQPTLIIEKNKSRDNLKEKNLIHPKPNKDVKGLNEFADLPKDELETEKDTSGSIATGFKDVLEEENLYAENNVTIVYEDEVLDENTDALDKKKMTKLEMVRTAVKHQFNGNLDKGKEKVLLALNTKPFNFLRKKEKK